MQQIRNILNGKRYQKRKIAKYYRNQFIEQMEQKHRNRRALREIHRSYFA